MNSPTTEQPSKYDNLEKMGTLELLNKINAEDKTVPLVIEKIKIINLQLVFF